MEKTQYPMPDPQDVPALVEELARKGSPLLASADVDALVKAALEEALTCGAAMVKTMAVKETLRRPADVGSDRGWGGTERLLLGVEQVCAEGSPTALEVDEAARGRRAALLRSRWMGGLGFLTLPFREQWREAQARLLRLDQPMGAGEETPRQALEALGFGWVIGRLQRLQATYGDVLGITADTGAEAATLIAWEEALDALLSGVHFRHRRDPQVRDAIFGPYEAALEASRARRRAARTRPDAT